VLTIARFVTCLDSLDAALSSTEFKNWSRAQDRDVREEYSACRLLISDASFTTLCAEIADFFGPALILLRVADSHAPNVSKMVPGSAQAKARMAEKAYVFAAR
jgi:hypothetical protein